MLQHSPPWVLRGACIDLDFQNDRYFGGYVSRRRLPGNEPGNLISYTNSGAAANTLCAVDNAGRVWLFDQYAIRVVPGQGLWVERNSRNYVLYSRDLTNSAWIASNMGTARNQTGADIRATANTATLLTASAANATVLQSITLASTQVVTSVFMKRVNGAGAVELTQDGGSTWTDISSQINSNGFTRVSISAQTLTNPQSGLRLATSGDSVAVDFFQTENSPFVTSPIATTASTVSRGSEMPMFGTTSTAYNDGQRIINDIHFGTPASMFCDFTGNGVASCRVKGGGNTPMWRLDGAADGGAAVFGTGATGTTASTSNSGNYGVGNFNKVAARINGAGCAVSLNGGAIATNTSKVAWSGTDDHIGLGNKGDGLSSINGYIRRLTLFKRELTDGELMELSR